MERCSLAQAKHTLVSLKYLSRCRNGRALEWKHTPLIPARGWQRQADLSEFCLVYTERPTRLHSETLSQNKKQKQQKYLSRATERRWSHTQLGDERERSSLGLWAMRELSGRDRARNWVTCPQEPGHAGCDVTGGAHLHTASILHREESGSNQSSSS